MPDISDEQHHIRYLQYPPQLTPSLQNQRNNYQNCPTASITSEALGTDVRVLNLHASDLECLFLG